VVARHEAGHAVVGTAVANILTGQARVEVNITGTLLLLGLSLFVISEAAFKGIMPPLMACP